MLEKQNISNRRTMSQCQYIDKLDIRVERETFYPGAGLEPGCPALRAGALTTELFRISTDP